MRKITSLILSVLINVCMLSLLLRLESTPGQKPPGKPVLLVFEEEEEVVITKEIEPIPFAAYDKNHFRSNRENVSAIMMPGPLGSDVNVTAPRLETAENAFREKSAEPGLFFPHQGDGELFIPSASELNLNLREEAGNGQAGGDRKGVEFIWNAGARVPVKLTEPEFPVSLAEQGLEVELDLTLTISAAGGITAVEVSRSSGFPSIDLDVRRIARGWVFGEAEQEDVTVVTVRYKLEKREL